MMPILENSIEVTERQDETPRFLLIGIFCVFYLLLALLGPINIVDGELLGTDSYTRLNRVLFVHEQGHWNNSIYPRSNAPYGESIHWTKPMDFLLLAGGTVLSFIMPFSDGLHIWGVLISPLLHVLAFMGMFYLMRESLDRLGMILLTIVFLVQPILTSYFTIGRPDHHSLILAVFCWFLVGLYRSPLTIPSWRSSILIGSLGAFGLWVSVEFLVPIGSFLGAFTIFWIWRGQKNTFHISRVMAVMFLLALLFLVIERFTENMFAIEYDKLSLPHCVLLGLIAMSWFGIHALDINSRGPSSILKRMIVIGTMSIGVGVVQWYLFPDFFKGPLVGMDSTIKALLWDKVAETQPLQKSEAIMNVGMGILVLPYLVYGIRRANTVIGQYQGILLLVGVSVFIPLAMYESRWTPYASILLIIPYVTVVRSALEWAGTRWPNRRGEAGSLIVGLVLLFWPTTVGKVMALDEHKIESSTMSGKCSLKSLGDYLRTDERWASTSQTILAFQDFGPELLYRTSHRVIGTPMHRNQDGVRDMLAIMRAEDLSISFDIIDRRNIDLIVICQHLKEESAMYRNAPGVENFYELLLRGDLPGWVKDVGLPKDLTESFKVFEVR